MSLSPTAKFPLHSRVVRIPTLHSKFRKVVDKSRRFFRFLRIHPCASRKTLYLFGDTGRSYTVQMEMVRNADLKRST